MLEHHDLVHEFPEHRQRIHDLKLADHHFARLFTEYHDLTKEVERIEAGAEAASDDRLTDLRKHRLHLKDELYAILVKAA
ncbi:MAG: DUF465 domain-containing protein [Alphaproteobacteria bacterium]|nr:DUF465 domain-containing protein [Alphaproteobacteria bacterium]TAD89824.1 MAG: DUF465 domain-containing protein [Alphaproteobacteria bacterium]